MGPWAEEIERLSGGEIIAVRIYTDPLRNQMRLPPETPHAKVLARYLKDPSFRSQLAAAHALSLNYQGREGRLHFILLNMALADQWAGAEDGLLGHELGHAWLAARGFRGPDYAPGPRACVSILTGDIVQHVILRAEIESRGIDYRAYWQRQLQAEAPEENAGACRRLILLAHLVDYRLGLTGDRSEALLRFEHALAMTNPLVLTYADRIGPLLDQADLTGAAGYRAALSSVGPLMNSLFDGLPLDRGAESSGFSQVLENKEEIHLPN